MRRTFAVVGLPILLMFASGCGSEAKKPPVVEESAHDKYLKENASGYDWFANASDGYGGVPLILLRTLPDLAPEIWGKPEEQFSRFGFISNANAPLPVGLSWDSMDPSHPAQ